MDLSSFESAGGWLRSLDRQLGEPLPAGVAIVPNFTLPVSLPRSSAQASAAAGGGNAVDAAAHASGFMESPAAALLASCAKTVLTHQTECGDQQGRHVIAHLRRQSSFSRNTRHQEFRWRPLRRLLHLFETVDSNVSLSRVGIRIYGYDPFN
jgi:hypothetical protein